MHLAGPSTTTQPRTSATSRLPPDANRTRLGIAANSAAAQGSARSTDSVPTRAIGCACGASRERTAWCSQPGHVPCWPGKGHRGALYRSAGQRQPASTVMPGKLGPGPHRKGRAHLPQVPGYRQVIRKGRAGDILPAMTCSSRTATATGSDVTSVVYTPVASRTSCLGARGLRSSTAGTSSSEDNSPIHDSLRLSRRNLSLAQPVPTLSAINNPPTPRHALRV